MKACLYCKATIYSDDEGMVCFRCKPHNVGVKAEIYDKETYEKGSEQDFSEFCFGNINYRKMRQKNIGRNSELESFLD